VETASDSTPHSHEKLDDQGALFFSDPSRKTSFEPFCTIPWTTTYVAFDGTVRPCCYSETATVLGNLRDQSFDEIWNGEAYRHLREEILDGEVPESCRQCVANARIHGRAVFDKFKRYL
jgi:radical SAM protein with 4Fe4S-binding SPASM domain